MDLLEQFIEWIKGIFTLKCPICGSKMESYFDSTIDKNIYECTEGHEWI